MRSNGNAPPFLHGRLIHEVWRQAEMVMPDIRHEVLIGASPETVFNSITSQEGLSAWWTPGAAVRAEVNAIARVPFGPDYFMEMKIVEIVPWPRQHG